MGVRDFPRKMRASRARTSFWKGKERKGDRKTHGHFGQKVYENAHGRLAADLTIAANCRQRRKRRSNAHSRTRKRIRIAAVRISKMALAAVARYHIGHLVDLVSSLSLSLRLSVPLLVVSDHSVPLSSYTIALHPSHVFHSRQKRFRLSPMSFSGFVTPRKARSAPEICLPIRRKTNGDAFVPWARLARQERNPQLSSGNGEKQRSPRTADRSNQPSVLSPFSSRYLRTTIAFQVRSKRFRI